MDTNWKDHSRMAQRGERGQDLAEFAIILPVLLLLILGIIEFGLLVYQYNAISNAAREGARYGIVHPDAEDPSTCAETKGPIADEACALTAGLDPAEVAVKVTVVEPPGTGTVIVLVTYNAQLITAPFIQAVGGGGAITLSSSATMNREQ